MLGNRKDVTHSEPLKLAKQLTPVYEAMVGKTAQYEHCSYKRKSQLIKVIFTNEILRENRKENYMKV